MLSGVLLDSLDYSENLTSNGLTSPRQYLGRLKHLAPSSAPKKIHVQNQEGLVRLAYTCRRDSVHQDMKDLMGENKAKKLARILRFMARPMIACLTFANTTKVLPHFQTLKIRPVEHTVAAGLNPRHCIPLQQVWNEF